MSDFKKERYWELVEDFVTELRTATYWCKPDGKPKKEWVLFEGDSWDAARNAALFAWMLVCLGLPMDKKHLIHLNERMEVWRKGYCLLCDVNGTLYVYAKKRTAQ